MLTVKDPKNTKWAEMSLVELAEGNAQDAFFTLRIYEYLLEELQKNPVVYKLYETMLSDMTSKFSDIELKGFLVSEEELNNVGRQLYIECAELEDQLYEAPQVDKEDKISSPADLCKILFLKEGAFELYPPQFTATNAPSSKSEVIETLINQIEAELSKKKK